MLGIGGTISPGDGDGPEDTGAAKPEGCGCSSQPAKDRLQGTIALAALAALMARRWRAG